MEGDAFLHGDSPLGEVSIGLDGSQVGVEVVASGGGVPGSAGLENALVPYVQRGVPLYVLEVGGDLRTGVPCQVQGSLGLGSFGSLSLGSLGAFGSLGALRSLGIFGLGGAACYHANDHNQGQKKCDEFLHFVSS